MIECGRHCVLNMRAIIYEVPVIWVILTFLQAVSGAISTANPCDNLPGNYQSWKSSATDVGEVIVGAGVAGLTAAKTLINQGVTDILILEAEDVLGGRVRTTREGSILVEEGAEWIHGGKRNPLFTLANNLQQVAPNLPDSAYDWRVKKYTGQNINTAGYDIIQKLINQIEKNGALKPYYNTALGQFFIDKFPSAYGSKWNSTNGRAWLYMLQKLVNGEEGCNDWMDLSARDVDSFISLGKDHQWKIGYDTLINHLKTQIPDANIKLSTAVCKIYWDESDGKVLLVTQDGSTTYSANHVIMTPSVGYLKERHEQLFDPSLPVSFVQDLDGIELGVADKVIIGWSEPWWGNLKPLDLLILWTRFDLPQEKTWLYGVAEVFSVHQQTAVVETIITGNEARDMETLPEETVKQHFLELLSNATRINVPQPIFFRRTQWLQNPWKRGSFSSFITVAGDAAGFRSRSQIAVPLKNSLGDKVVLWAGEHTHNTRYSTVDGAMKTGQRQANKLLKMLNK